MLGQVREVAEILLPLLLHRGLVDSSKEVQAVSVLMLVKVVKGACDGCRCLRQRSEVLIQTLLSWHGCGRLQERGTASVRICLR